jgi:hypothetical protein
MSELGPYQGGPTIMRKTLDWNRSRISMLEVEAVPQRAYLGSQRITFQAAGGHADC